MQKTDPNKYPRYVVTAFEHECIFVDGDEDEKHDSMQAWINRTVSDGYKLHSITPYRDPEMGATFLVVMEWDE